MTKRFLSVILSVMIIINLLSAVTLTVSATNIGTYNGLIYKKYSYSACAIMGYTGTESNLVIPTKIDNKIVTAIADRAFENSTILKSITLPKALRDIGFDAFKGCENLSQISFAGKNGYLFYQRFNDTAWYKNQKDGVIYLENFIYGYKGEIPENLTIPYNKDITYLGNIAFRGRSDLKYLTLPNNITHFGEYAFTDCVNLKRINFPTNLTTMGSFVFHNCESLEDVTFTNDLHSGGMWAFVNCKSLKRVIIRGNVGGEWFGYCHNVKYAELHGTNTELTDAFFAGFTGLEELIIEEGVISLGERFIGRYESLRYLEIPKSVTEIIPDSIPYSPNLTIYGYKNTAAEKYAKNKGINFVTIPEHEHKFEFNKKVTPNCVDDGYSLYKCQSCDIIRRRDFVNSTGHNYEFYKTVNPTCDTDGYTIYECTECGESENRDTVKATGHNYEQVQVVHPTCTEKGYTLMECTNCNASYKENYTDIVDHKYINGSCEGCGKFIGSDHNYKDNIDQIWTITKENVCSIELVFSKLTETEKNCDFIYIYDKSDNIVGKYSGKELSNQTFKVKGDTVKIRLVSDKDINYYGFEVTNIKYGNILSDADSDGDVTIQDVTTAQRYLANQITLSTDIIEAIDLDYNNYVTINDVTLMQRYIAGQDNEA
ncbi:MAG: leucine-rich repeat protein [Ruminococcus sp.]|nr:leucine-rich repeat protein [Ruminococcus sp.]